MSYTYEEIIPENENARLVCEDLAKNYHVNFPSKYMTEREAVLFYLWINDVPSDLQSDTREVCKIPIYDIGKDKWYKGDFQCCQVSQCRKLTKSLV